MFVFVDGYSYPFLPHKRGGIRVAPEHARVFQRKGTRPVTVQKGADYYYVDDVSIEEDGAHVTLVPCEPPPRVVRA